MRCFCRQVANYWEINAALLDMNFKIGISRYLACFVALCWAILGGIAFRIKDKVMVDLAFKLIADHNLRDFGFQGVRLIAAGSAQNQGITIYNRFIKR